MSDTAELAAPSGTTHETPDRSPAAGRAPSTRAADLARRSAGTWLHAVGFFVASRLVVFVATAVTALLDPTRSYLAIANAWDSQFYVDIAKFGYPKSVPHVAGETSQLRTAFFPAYSILIKLLHGTGLLSWRYSAHAIALACGLTATILLWFFIRELHGPLVADRAVAVFCFFPGAFVMSMSYSEPMFLALAIGCLWALVRRNWLLAGVLAAVATATRSNGLALCAACAFASGAAIYQRREWRSLIAPALSPLGMLAYFAYLWRHTGDAAVWFKVQKYGWDERFDPLVFPHTVRKFLQHPSHDINVMVIMISSAFLLGLLFFVPRSKLPWTLYVYAAVIILMTLYAYNLEPKPRFLLTAFPFLLAPLERMRPASFQILLTVMAGGLAILTALALGGVYVTP